VTRLPFGLDRTGVWFVRRGDEVHHCVPWQRSRPDAKWQSGLFEFLSYPSLAALAVERRRYLRTCRVPKAVRREWIPPLSWRERLIDKLL
jgi:hypothetical protein